MDRLAPQLAGERLAAFADGVRARRNDKPITCNPFGGNLLRKAQAREWSDGWNWSDKFEKHGTLDPPVSKTDNYQGDNRYVK